MKPIDAALLATILLVQGCGVILFPARVAVDATVEAVDLVTRDANDGAYPSELATPRRH